MSEFQFDNAFYFVTGLLLVTSIAAAVRYFGKRAETTEKINRKSKWNGLEELKIIDIKTETSDIKTYKLVRANGRQIPPYKGGQFLSFKIADDNKTLRSYSMSSSCEILDYIQVSIKKITEGVGSSWFHDLTVGTSVWAHPPSGLFVDEHLPENRQRIYVAGGIGITPILSMLLSATDKDSEAPMTLFYGARSVEDLAFHDVLTTLSEEEPNFTYIPVISEEKPKNWKGLTGFIDYSLIKSKAKHLDQSEFYFCGPTIMTDAIMEDLESNGIDKKHIHNEKFISPTDVKNEKIESHDVLINFEGKQYKYHGKDSILEFLESKGLDIPYACRSGVCGTCKLKCKEGKYTSLSDSGLEEADKSEYFLSCVTFPDGNLTLSED